jgi:hypothetical protein
MKNTSTMKNLVSKDSFKTSYFFAIYLPFVPVICLLLSQVVRWKCFQNNYFKPVFSRLILSLAYSISDNILTLKRISLTLSSMYISFSRVIMSSKDVRSWLYFDKITSILYLIPALTPNNKLQNQVTRQRYSDFPTFGQEWWSYLLTYFRNWPLLEKPPMWQPLKKFPALYGTRMFIAVVIKHLLVLDHSG